MKKTVNSDIKNLFRKFGGDSGNYQEIQQDYVVDKAQKNWPIVAALEKERVSAPILKSAVNSGSHVAAAARGAASFVPQSVTSVARHTPGKPVAEQPANAKTTSAIFGKRADEPSAKPVSSLFGASRGVEKPVVTPAHSLFGGLNRGVKPSAEPAHSLFGGQHAAAKPSVSQAASPLFRAQPAQLARSENDTIGSVFSRLLNPHNKEAENFPDGSLRSLFGFLKK
jgi:hypothetical protein